MKISYMVVNLEVSGGGLQTHKKFVFDTAEQAIEFRKKQRDGYFSWWEIILNYTD